MNSTSEVTRVFRSRWFSWWQPTLHGFSVQCSAECDETGAEKSNV